MTTDPSLFCPNNANAINDIRHWIYQQALDLGFSDCGFVSVEHPLFAEQTKRLQAWLAKGYAGQLQFLYNHHDLRADPTLLVAGSKTIISVRMDYLCQTPKPRQVADNDRPNHAIIARYARGRDYHKTIRGRLKKLAQHIQQRLSIWQQDYPTLNINADSDFVYRPFSDSAPIFERAIAEAAGLGWAGKHTLMINRRAGSFFVLGELFISLDLTVPDTADLSKPSNLSKSSHLVTTTDHKPKRHCGSCTACLDICPTQAIVSPNEVNASACISYLTIEHDGSIPKQYRQAIGNRIFGCDDCQLICPWNKFAKLTTISDFEPRHGLDNIELLQLWAWSEADFDKHTQGSPLRRTGYVNLLRNVAIAIGNAMRHNAQHHQSQLNDAYLTALHGRLGEHGEMLDEHIHWAIKQAQTKQIPIKNVP